MASSHELAGTGHHASPFLHIAKGNSLRHHTTIISESHQCGKGRLDRKVNFCVLGPAVGLGRKSTADATPIWRDSAAQIPAREQDEQILPIRVLFARSGSGSACSGGCRLHRIVRFGGGLSCGYPTICPVEGLRLWISRPKSGRTCLYDAHQTLDSWKPACPVICL